MLDILVGAIAAFVVISVIYYQRTKKKKGGCSGCMGCQYRHTCDKKKGED